MRKTAASPGPSAPQETKFHRLFLAIAVPEEVRQRLETVQAEARHRLRDASITWTRAENVHLTLRFFGSVDASRTSELFEGLRRGCCQFGPLRLCCRGLGIFPPRKRPHVFWAGVIDEQNYLPDIVRAIDSTTAGFGEDKPEKPFTGHITLGRIKRIERREVEQLGELIRKMEDVVFGKWPVEELLLMRSQLLPEGAEHSILERVKLTGGVSRDADL